MTLQEFSNFKNKNILLMKNENGQSQYVQPCTTGTISRVCKFPGCDSEAKTFQVCRGSGDGCAVVLLTCVFNIFFV